jgi:hypothetical protein
MSYMQYMTDMVVEIFNIKIDDPDEEAEEESDEEEEPEEEESEEEEPEEEESEEEAPEEDEDCSDNDTAE